MNWKNTQYRYNRQVGKIHKAGENGRTACGYKVENQTQSKWEETEEDITCGRCLAWRTDRIIGVLHDSKIR